MGRGKGTNQNAVFKSLKYSCGIRDDSCVAAKWRVCREPATSFPIVPSPVIVGTRTVSVQFQELYFAVNHDGSARAPSNPAPPIRMRDRMKRNDRFPRQGKPAEY